MRVVLVEALRGLRVITSAVGVEMAAPPVVTMVLMANDGTTATIVLVSSVVVPAVGLIATTARLGCVAVSTPPTVVVARLLLAACLVLVSLALVLVLSHLLVLEMDTPITVKVVTEFVWIQRVVWSKWINFLVVC